jgi:hypothetical protein
VRLPLLGPLSLPPVVALAFILLAIEIALSSTRLRSLA